MSETSSATPRSGSRDYPEVTINPQVLHRSQLLFRISLISFMALLVLIFSPMLMPLITGRPTDVRFDFGASDAGPMTALFALYFPHVLLFVTTIVSGFIGYKLVVAAGASPENPIPPSNYSSLSGFTGTFTKLGLTGLPLTTVGLTLLFALFALLPLGAESQKSFFDLTKLTLGAFIGSFVQRQVEQRRTPGAKGDESRSPLTG